MRLIDADELKKAFKKSSVIYGVYLHYARQIIEDAPTIAIPTAELDTTEDFPESWEYLKEHITEMRDADGKLNQKETCQFILNLMGVIEKGDKEE